MGVLLSYNASQELDQTSQAVFRAICLQLAEAACEEAAGILLTDKANRAWRTGIYEIATTSDIGKNGSRNSPKLLGSNPYAGGDITDQCKHTKELCENYAGYFGKYTLEGVEVYLRGIQPIIYPATYMNADNYYRPKDRGFLDTGGRPFITEPEKHRDWQGQFEILARVSHRGVGATSHTIRDIKIVNVGPLARQYSLFSMFGPANAWDVQNDLNIGGVLFINNNKKKGKNAALAVYDDDRARVYLRGPYLVKVEANTAYSKSQFEDRPYNNIVYDVQSKSYKSWSLMPEPRSLWDFKGTGHIPTEQNKNLFFDIFKGAWKGGEKYYRGSIEKQRFIPSAYNLWGRPRGPKFEKKLFKKTIDAHFDNDKNSYGIEHHWDPKDKSVEKKHRIMGVYRRATVWPGFINFPVKEFFEELRFTRIKPSWWKNLFSALKRIVLPWNPLATITGNAWSWIKGLFGGKSFSVSSIKMRNTLPTNYKSFKQAAVRSVPDLTWLYAKDDPLTPKDESLYYFPTGQTDKTAHLPLNGIYWITDKCNINRETTFTGKGMVISTSTKNKMTIEKSIQPPVPPAGEILCLLYHPQKGMGEFGNPDKDQLYLKGKALYLNQVSLFSIFGLKTDPGSNHILEGNYVNWFMKKAKQRGSLKIDYPQSGKYSIFREEDNNDISLKAWDYSVNVSPIVSFSFAR
ncbi:hypothetical protein ACFL35_09560 [Candidatus Riflebacteria bacterium]